MQCNPTDTRAANSRLASLFGLAAAVAVTLPVAADQIRVDYAFDQPQVSQVKVEATSYDRLLIGGCTNGGLPGEPALPAAGACILLPYGTAVDSIEIVTGPPVRLGEGYLVLPVAQPVPLSAGPGAAPPPTPDRAIYASDQPFPGSRYDAIGTQAFRGYDMLVLKLEPVDYVPATGELFYHPEMTVVVNTVDAPRANALFRGLDRDEAQVRQRIDNPDALATYPAPRGRGGRGYDLLILTKPEYAAGFEPLRDGHSAHGLATEIHTTDEVPGTDPDDVRAYLRDRYDADGIEYVLIGGDDDVIPCKDLFVENCYGYTEYNMPGDIYFACLDGTWNYDGDGKWGEPTDGEGGGDVDLVAEIFVGRACIGGIAEVERFVEKTLWYLNNQHSRPESVQLVGEWLGFGGESEYAGNVLDELVDGSDAYGYTTVGFPSDIYEIDKLYERDWPGHDWPASELIARMENGIHMLDHLGHGSPDGAMKLGTGDLLGLDNADLFFVYSQTCSAGHLDGTDCWAEYASVKAEHGAFGVIMNAREGWGEFDSTDGPSQRFNREFWDAVFSPAEGMAQVGRANHDSKEDNLYRIGETCMRWCYYETNLFGDPSLAFREISGMGVSPGSGLESEGPYGGPFEPTEITYTVINHDETLIDFEVDNSEPWVELSTAGGTIPGGGEVEVTVWINDLPLGFPNGHYEDFVHFVNTTTHEGDTTRPVTLDVGVPVPVITFDMDTNPGWSMNDEWAFGKPTGQGGYLHGNPDPTSGATGENVCGINLNGDYSDDQGPWAYLTTNAIDCSELFDVGLHFQRWLNSDYQPYVYATLEVSNNASDWTMLWQNGGDEIADSSWKEQAFDVSDIADFEETVYIRWGHKVDSSGAYAYSGWNIDDVEIWAVDSSGSDCPEDVTGDDVVDVLDLLAVLAAWGDTGALPEDVTGDGVVDVLDLLAVLGAWGPCP